MVWTLLRSRGDWDDYQNKTAADLGVSGLVQWGDGPKEYPCLIVTCALPRQPAGPLHMLSAYVYRADAEVLLAGERTAAGAAAQSIGPGAGSSQDNFNRHQAATALTVAWFLRETGICTAEKYEQKLMEAISLVDALVTEQRDKVLASAAAPDRAILNRLYPPPPVD